MAVQVERVIGHGQVAHAYAHAVALANVHGIDPREYTGVDGPQVEVEHGIDLGRVAAWLDVVIAKQKYKVAVDLHEVPVLRMRHPEAHHSHCHLHHFICMRVVHEGARAFCFELVHEGLAGRDARLRQSGHAIHAVGQALAMPVDAGVLRQPVGDEYTDSVAFDDLDGGARRLAVVAPQIGLHAGRDFAHHGLGDQVEFLDVIVHAPG